MSKGTPLQPVAFTLGNSLQTKEFVVKSMSFPSDWWAPFQGLQEELQDRGGLPNSFANRSLNNVLEALIPGLVATPRTLWAPRSDQTPSQDPWLIALEVVPPEKLFLITQAWLERSYGTCPSYRQVQQMLRVEDLVWNETELNLFPPPTPNGTSVLPPLAYNALPALIADRLITNKVMLPIQNEQRALLRVPVEKGAELVTWPPVYYHDDKDQRWAWSWIVTLTAQTLPGSNHPRVHVHYGVRRWTSHSLFKDGVFYLKGNDRRRVFIHSTQPWLGLPEARTFTIARLATRIEEGQRQPVWDDLGPEIMQRLRVPIPNAQDLMLDPARWLEGKEGIQAALPIRHARNYPVQPGMGPETHGELTACIVEALKDDLVLVPEVQGIGTLKKISKHPLQHDLREMDADARLRAFEQSVGPNATIEVWYLNPEGRDMLVDRIHAMLTGSRPDIEANNDNQEEGSKAWQADLFGESVGVGAGKSKSKSRRQSEGIPTSAPEESKIALPSGGRIRIITHPLPTWGQPLPRPNEDFSTRGSRAKHKRQESENRLAEMRRELQTTEEPTLALVEMPNYRNPQYFALRQRFGHSDPKPMARLGLARSGRVNQFTEGASRPPSPSDTEDTKREELRLRCGKAVLDGMRQLGYLPVPIGYEAHSNEPNLPADLTVVAIWQVRLTKRRVTSGTRVYLPVVVIMDTRSARVLAWLPDGKGIRSYREALLDITTMPPETVSRRRQEEVMRMVRNLLTRDLPAEGITELVVLTVAHNLRLLWSGLANGEIALDGTLRWEKGKSARPVPQGFRLIRLRTTEGGETPEWYVPTNTGKRYVQGIWPVEAENARLFYNLSSKPSTMSGYRAGKQKDATEHYAVPSLLEILVACQDDSDPTHLWPKAIDQWRRMALVTNDMTLYPLPLMLAKAMDEYAMVIGPWITKDWDEEEEEDGNEAAELGIQLSFWDDESEG